VAVRSAPEASSAATLAAPTTVNAAAGEPCRPEVLASSAARAAGLAAEGEQQPGGGVQAGELRAERADHPGRADRRAGAAAQAAKARRYVSCTRSSGSWPARTGAAEPALTRPVMSRPVRAQGSPADTPAVGGSGWVTVDPWGRYHWLQR